MSALDVHLRAVGAIGPGFADWPALREFLAHPAARASGETTVVPALSVLPPAERRRVGAVVKLAIATGLQTCAAAGADPATLATVFASSGGDGNNCHIICETLASDDRLISPTRFHNSVNNAASGYWGIATGAQAASTIVSAYDGSFAAGLLEAAVQVRDTGAPVLLIAYDLPYPAPLAAARPITDALGLGLLLGAQAQPGDLARLSLTLTDERPDRLADPGLEALRTGIPCARALPLLAALADEGGACVLEHLDGTHLAVRTEILA